MDIKKKIIISVVIAVVVLAGIGYFIWTGGYKDFLRYQGQQGTEQQITLENGEVVNAVVVATGTSAITEDGKVVNINTGQFADNEAESGTPSAPQQSNPVNEKEIPNTVVKISASSSGFTPNVFEVRAESPVSLSITAEDMRSYIFAFKDPLLAGVRVGVTGGSAIDKTRVIVFNAPSAKGEYAFFSDVPGQTALTGKMIVK